MSRPEQLASPFSGHHLGEALQRWLFSGRPQSERGAYCAWRDRARDELVFEYPEINGYALTYTAGLAVPRPDEIATARRAASWLTERLGRGDYSAREGWDADAIYTFDVAMIANGLMSFGRRFGDERHLEAGLAATEFLVAETDAAGRLPAVARGPQATHKGWATEGRAHLLKAVQCLLLADELAATGTTAQARLLIEEARGLQQPDGRFLTDPRDNITMLHPHHYALEGLWIWSEATGERWAADRARRGVEWAFAQQLQTGGFPRFVASHGGEPGVEQADATAQAVRMAFLLGVEPRGLDRAVERIAELTVGDERVRACVYQPLPEPPHENVWATLFAAQAFELAAAEAPALDWWGLV